MLVFCRQCSGDAVALGDVQGLQTGRGMGRGLRQPAGYSWDSPDLPRLWQTGSCCTPRCGHVPPGELVIYVAVRPYLCSSLPREGRQDQTVMAGERDCVFAAAEQLDVSGCKWELCASCPVHTAICVCSCMSCQRLLNASVALASSLLVCILMRRHLLKCIHLVSIWPCRGFKLNAHF